jgi:hypothetical protein
LKQILADGAPCTAMPRWRLSLMEVLRIFCTSMERIL